MLHKPKDCEPRRAWAVAACALRHAEDDAAAAAMAPRKSARRLKREDVTLRG